MGQVNYSIRLDEEKREKMRDIPDMTDRIRDFIDQEIERHEQDGELPGERFCHRILDEYGLVGAYCLYQRDLYIRNKSYYLGNIETRFEDTEVDVAEARLAAKRIWNEWEDLPESPSEVVEDILDIEGYIDDFYESARDIAQNAADEGGVQLWALWTVTQLYRHTESRSSRDNDNYRLNKKSITNTLEQHGFTEDEISTGHDVLIKVGGLQNLYNSNAYTYRYIRFNEYVIDAIEEGLMEHRQSVRTTVDDYCEEEPYLDKLLDLTRGDDYNPYAKDLTEQDESDVKNAVKDGAIVLQYSPSRSSTGRRSSLPSKTKCVLCPEIRDIVSDGIYRLKA